MQYALSDSPWDWSKDKLPGKESDPGRSGGDNRRFIEAILWVGRNGARWRAIPNQYGHWNSIYRRFRRWSRQGLWQMIFNTLAAKADTEWLMLDSTIVRAHQHAAGAKGGPQNEALGRSRGGFSTKLQAVGDALGHALRLILTGGQAADCKPALALLDGLKADAVWALRKPGELPASMSNELRACGAVAARRRSSVHHYWRMVGDSSWQCPR